jgi:hypothetical protein
MYIWTKINAKTFSLRLNQIPAKCTDKEPTAWLQTSDSSRPHQMRHPSLNYISCYERRYLKAAFTLCKFAHASKEPGMRAKTFQLASKFSLLNFPQFVWNVCVRIPGTWLARANLHPVKATEVHLSPSQSCGKVWWTLLISGCWEHAVHCALT